MPLVVMTRSPTFSASWKSCTFRWRFRMGISTSK
jgi:hypothetical protein